MSDYKGAALMIDALPRAKALLDANWFRRPRRAQDHRLHPVKGQPKGADPARRRTLSPAPQDREDVRQAQGLAAHPHSL